MLYHDADPGRFRGGKRPGTTSLPKGWTGPASRTGGRTGETPSGFFVEYGWGGRVIDPATWQPHETFDGPSFWGHERLYLPDKERARLRDARLEAAARGVRAPMEVNCPWLEGVKRNA